MWSGLRTFVLCILLGGSGIAAADVEPAADSASLNSALARPTLRQAEIFFASRNREIQLRQGLVERAQADRLSAASSTGPTMAIPIAGRSPHHGS